MNALEAIENGSIILRQAANNSTQDPMNRANYSHMGIQLQNAKTAVEELVKASKALHDLPSYWTKEREEVLKKFNAALAKVENA